MNNKRAIFQIVPVVVIAAIGIFLFTLLSPAKVKSANFTSASATMENSRYSYFAGISSGTSGSSNITINTSGYPDLDVDHLFPKDTVCFAPELLFGCRDDTAYEVTSTEGVDGDQFTIGTPLGTTLDATDVVIASQSGEITIAVTLTNTVPDGGDLYISIPMADGEDGNDSFPDYNTTVATSGFDLNGMTAGAGDISVTRTSGGVCADGNWNDGSATITEGSGSTDHTIRVDRSGASCASTAVLSIRIGVNTGLLNPAPIFTGRTQGTADEYTINVKTRDNSDATIDNSDVMVAPIEAVLVSATVEETLSFQVAGLASSTSACGVSTDVTTTAMAVPWGTISTSATFFDAAQQLTVSTNANNGYSVTIQENDQMGKDGATCTGTAPSAGHFTFSGSTCIRDTVCGATPCSESAGYNWTDASTYPGLGFSLGNVGGDTDAAFVYNSNDPCSTSAGAGSFCSRQIADVTQGGETANNVMTKSSPADTADAYVCYRIAVPGTQPAGYYYNKVRYTAIPVF